MSDPDDDEAGSSPRRADVVVVTHRGPSATAACLESIEQHRTSSLGSLVVVDNGTEQDDDALSYGSPQAALIHTQNNGYGAAVNAGVTALRGGDAPGEVVIALNDDVVVTNGWIEALLAGFTSPAVGAVQPKMLLGDMSTIDSLGVDLDRYGAGHDIGHGEADDRSRPAGPIDIFTGGAVAFRRAFLHDLGGFDERFFLYYEDVDLALRGAEQGWTYRCHTDAVVAHAKGASTSALGTELRRLQERNRLWVAIRFGSPSDIRSALWLSIRRLRHQPVGAHAAALAQGLRAAPRLIRSRRRGRGAM